MTSLSDLVKNKKDVAVAAKDAAKAAKDASKTAKTANDLETAHVKKDLAKTKAKEADDALNAAKDALMAAGDAVASDADKDAVHAAAADVISILSASSEAVLHAKESKKDNDGEGSDDQDDFLKDYDDKGCKRKSPRPVTDCINCNTDNKPGISLGCCFKWGHSAYKNLNDIVKAGGVVAWNSACSGRTVICGGTGDKAVSTAIGILQYLKALGFIAL